jgi:hypothetical protein
MADPDLTASLHRRLAEVEAQLLLQERRLQAPAVDAAGRADAERRAADLRRRRDELRALLAGTRGV